MVVDVVVDADRTCCKRAHASINRRPCSPISFCKVLRVNTAIVVAHEKAKELRRQQGRKMVMGWGGFVQKQGKWARKVSCGGEAESLNLCSHFKPVENDRPSLVVLCVCMLTSIGGGE